MSTRVCERGCVGAGRRNVKASLGNFFVQNTGVGRELNLPMNVISVVRRGLCFML